MAQTGFTPIQIYSSSTAAAAPAVGNLINSTLGSELAINITDGKLFYKDNANAIQVIAWKVTPTTAGGTGVTSYAAGDMLFYASGTVLSKLTIGASGRYLSSSGTAPQWSAPAALTKTDDTNVTLTLGGSASTALLNAASLTLGWTGTLAVSRGGTGASSASITAFNNITGYTATGATGTTSTNLVFSTSPTITTPTLAGDVNLSTGNITQGTAAKGFNFTANANAAGMTSELFNWYEEGTFTPTVIGSTTNPTVTYGFQRARYTRIGRVVSVSVYMTWSAFTGGSGNVGVGSLPFTVESNPGSYGGGAVSLLDGFTLSAGRTSVAIQPNPNTTYALVTCCGSGVSTQYVGVGSVAAAGAISFTVTYSV